MSRSRNEGVVGVIDTFGTPRVAVAPLIGDVERVVRQCTPVSSVDVRHHIEKNQFRLARILVVRLKRAHGEHAIQVRAVSAPTPARARRGIVVSKRARARATDGSHSGARAEIGNRRRIGEDLCPHCSVGVGGRILRSAIDDRPRKDEERAHARRDSRVG